MCLIAYQPAKDQPFTREILANGWSHNPHGAGFMFAHDGKVVIRKPFYRLHHLVQAYEEDFAKYGESSPFVVHFRWATHGGKSEVNIHPHELAGGKAGLVHNGVLSHFLPPFNADISDTAFFCRTVLACRTSEQLTDLEFGKVLAEMIDESNKFVILGHDGNAIIVNHDAGKYDGSRWYSNDDWRSQKSQKYTYHAASPPATIGRGQQFSTLPKRYMPPDAIEYDPYEEYENGGPEAAPLFERLNGAERQELERVYDDIYDAMVDARYPNGGLAIPAAWDELEEDAWKEACAAMERDVA